ncbi:MAG: ATP-binding protein [Methanolinea sp.]|nr:ATP-binding protein [Methanolinea sp.]
MRVVVASGKGGTGKTLVAANLAAVVSGSREVVLVDCDVEEPNLHLFFPSETKTLPVLADVPVFDQLRCDHCGECARTCQYGAIVVLPQKNLFFPEMCHGCGGCEITCPQGAISMRKREVGRVEFSRPRCHLTLISGVLNEREVAAPRVIREALLYAGGHPLVICDAPPGTACPLVETLEGADYCVLVTEPTPFGLHDLSLAAGVADVLGVPAGVVINRSMGEDGMVREFCRSKNIPVLWTIPFDRRIAELANDGKLLADGVPGIRELFLGLFAKVSGRGEPGA